MPRIKDWSEEYCRVVTITVEGVREHLVELELTFESYGKRAPERLFKIHLHGLCQQIARERPNTWYPTTSKHDPATVPDWVSELVDAYSRHDDPGERERADLLAAKWLRGFEPSEGS